MSCSTSEGFSGVDFLLEVENPDVPDTWVTVGGLKANSFQINNEQFDASSKDGTRWMKMISGGIQKMSASGSGNVKSDVVAAYLRELLMANESARFRMTSGLGDEWIACMFLKTLQRQGSTTAIEDYSISLESAGDVTHTEPDPELLTVAPTAGPGTLLVAGGTPITITGTGFQYGMGITIGGNAVTGVVIVSSILATGIAPAHAAGLVSGTVTNDDGGTDTTAGVATYA
jgi:predicted secreted protein